LVGWCLGTRWRNTDYPASADNILDCPAKVKEAIGAFAILRAAAWCACRLGAWQDRRGQLESTGQQATVGRANPGGQ